MLLELYRIKWYREMAVKTTLFIPCYFGRVSHQSQWIEVGLSKREISVFTWWPWDLMRLCDYHCQSSWIMHITIAGNKQCFHCCYPALLCLQLVVGLWAGYSNSCYCVFYMSCSQHHSPSSPTSVSCTAATCACPAAASSPSSLHPHVSLLCSHRYRSCR